MNRAEIERLVTHIYAVRKLNDAAKAAGLFAPDAVFELAGSAGPGRIAARVQGHVGMSDMMGALVNAWEWLDHEVSDLVIDGNRAAIRYKTRQRFIPTNQVVVTDLFDLVTFNDAGKIVHMVEFCDTALASDLIQTAMAQATGKQG
jgi:ketosteroid isomerase-like protein